MTSKPYKNAIILWQEDPEDGVAEKPILIEYYNDVISLTQEDNRISLNYESVKELISCLKNPAR